MSLENVEFESAISELTMPLNGQYPRPWMTKLKNPLAADVFIVGKNQRNGYDCSALGSHKRHVNALFNREGEDCRALYDEMTHGRASPTRRNTDHLTSLLESQGVNNILETNVICYSTSMSADLRLPGHAGGAEKGDEIFRYLFTTIQPKVLIVHGAGARKKLALVLGVNLGQEPTHPSHVSHSEMGAFHVIVIPSLAPPAYNKWSAWAPEHLQEVAKKVAALLAK